MNFDKTYSKLFLDKIIPIAMEFIHAWLTQRCHSRSLCLKNDSKINVVSLGWFPVLSLSCNLPILCCRCTSHLQDSVVIHARAHGSTCMCNTNVTVSKHFSIAWFWVQWCRNHYVLTKRPSQKCLDWDNFQHTIKLQHISTIHLY